MILWLKKSRTQEKQNADFHAQKRFVPLANQQLFCYNP